MLITALPLGALVAKVRRPRTFPVEAGKRYRFTGALRPSVRPPSMATRDRLISYLLEDGAEKVLVRPWDGYYLRFSFEGTEGASGEIEATQQTNVGAYYLERVDPLD